MLWSNFPIYHISIDVAFFVTVKSNILKQFPSKIRKKVIRWSGKISISIKGSDGWNLTTYGYARLICDQCYWTDPDEGKFGMWNDSVEES
jgi:hypothetical protein